jgi:hypothetical protein
MLFPSGMWAPVDSVETRGGRSTWLCGISFLTAMAGPLLSPESGQSDKHSNLEEKSFMRF